MLMYDVRRRHAYTISSPVSLQAELKSDKKFNVLEFERMKIDEIKE